MSEPILEADGLKKFFSQQTSLLSGLTGRSRDPIQAVDDVSFSISSNDSVAIIGESGCGKTTLLFTLMGLHDPTAGALRFHGRDTREFSRGDWKQYRRNVQIIFQDPFNSLDPKYSVRETLMEPLKTHGFDDREERIHEVLNQVELRPPEAYIDSLPHQLSGGEKQRVSIARALVVEPDVILADEPVSMLDVSTQAAVLDLLSRLVDDTGSALVYVSHDLSTVSYVCQDTMVMYLGRVVEREQTKTLLRDPKHPYTQELVKAIPVPDPHRERQWAELEGSPSDPIGIGEGCRFRDRCPERMDICEQTPRDVTPDNGAGQVACHLYYDHESGSMDERGVRQ